MGSRVPCFCRDASTHKIPFAREVDDEVCFLFDGAILERGAPDDELLGRRQQPRPSASCAG